jgi:calcineurin-like phosphoesterase family protein
MKLTTTFNKNDIFFISDLHFNHENIIAFCERDFLNKEDMDRVLIERWNQKVPEHGKVFMLGDFCFHSRKSAWEKYVSQLNGTIYHVRGNHDKYQITPDKQLQEKTLYDILEINVQNDNEDEVEQKIILCHYPLSTWYKKEKGSWHLFGHCHGSFKHPHYAALDVGVDTLYADSYRPLSYNTIEILITQKFLNS